MNEIIFIIFAIFLLALVLLALRYGKLYLFVLSAIYTLLMNIFVLKQFDLFGLAITGGNALYGATFLITDVLSEHFSKRDAFRAVLIGFLVSIVYVISTQVLLAFSANDFDFAQPHLQALFSLAPRILLGSMLAYLIAQSLDVWLYGKIRKMTKEKYLWLRNNASTFISQFVDTIIFTTVGLTTFSWLPIAGVINSEIFWSVAIATYFIKIVIALIDTPFMYLSYKIKK